MIQGVIFDADGTLFNSMHIWNEVGARYLTGLGKAPEEGLADILFSMTLEESSSYLKNQYKLSESVAVIKTGVLQIVADFYRQEVTLKHGVSNFLKELHQKQIPMTIATSGDRELLISALKRLQIHHYFKSIFTCSELHTSKQDGTIYQAAADFLGSDISHTVVFEDVLFALTSAHKAGFITVAVEDAASSHEKEKIQSIADFYMVDFGDFEGFWEFVTMRKKKIGNK